MQKKEYYHSVYRPVKCELWIVRVSAIFIFYEGIAKFMEHPVWTKYVWRIIIVYAYNFYE